MEGVRERARDREREGGDGDMSHSTATLTTELGYALFLVTESGIPSVKQLGVVQICI